MSTGPDDGPVRVGQEITVGWMVLEADEPVAVSSVSLVMGKPGLAVIGGPYVWDANRPIGAVASEYGWPLRPNDDFTADQLPTAMPGSGFVVEPTTADGASGTAVLFGLRFEGPERATFIGYDVVYTVGDAEYREFFSSSFAVCPGDPCESEQTATGSKTPPGSS